MKGGKILPEVPVTPRLRFVYLLVTCDNRRRRTYVGWSYNVDERLKAHNVGRGANAIKGRRRRVIHVEEHERQGGCNIRRVVSEEGSSAPINDLIGTHFAVLNLESSYRLLGSGANRGISTIWVYVDRQGVCMYSSG